MSSSEQHYFLLDCETLSDKMGQPFENNGVTSDNGECVFNTGQHIRIPWNSNLDRMTSGAFIAVRFKADSNPNAIDFVPILEGPNPEWTFGFNSHGFGSIFGWYTDCGVDHVSGWSSLNTWNEIGVNTDSSGRTFYLGENPIGTCDPAIGSAMPYLDVGHGPFGGQEDFHGRMEYVYIGAKPISHQEIRALLQGPSDAPTAPTSPATSPAAPDPTNAPTAATSPTTSPDTLPTSAPTTPTSSTTISPIVSDPTFTPITPTPPTLPPNPDAGDTTAGGSSDTGNSVTIVVIVSLVLVLIIMLVVIVIMCARAKIKSLLDDVKASVSETKDETPQKTTTTSIPSTKEPAFSVPPIVTHIDTNMHPIVCVNAVVVPRGDDDEEAMREAPPPFNPTYKDQGRDLEALKDYFQKE